MKKHLKFSLLLTLALAWCATTTFAQNNAVYGANQATPGVENVLLGFKAGNNLGASAKFNTISGTGAASSISSSSTMSLNSYYGYFAGRGHKGEVNTFLGAETGGPGASVGSLYAGYGSGNGTSGEFNVMLGYKAGSGLGNVGNQLYIDVNGGAPLIYGDFGEEHVGINTTEPLSTFDVRGSNVIVTDPGTDAGNFIFNRAVAIGQSGGPGGTSTCDLYGFRSQTDISNAINVGMNANIPTVLWGSTTDDLTFAVRNPSSSVSCSTRILRLGTNIAGSTYEFILDGSGRVNGSWLVLSDKSLKTDIKTIGNALDKITRLNGVTYSYDQKANPNMELPEGTVYGFIAQEVKAVIPEVTSTSKEDGLVGVKYTEIIPLLTEGIKEQQAVIEDQQAQIIEQEEKIASLEDRLAAIERNLSTSQNATTTFSNVKLNQNRPNPFSNATTIEYEIPTDAANASLDIFTMSGQLVNSFNIEGGAGVVELNANVLKNGTYVYAINLDGANVATNIMIVQK